MPSPAPPPPPAPPVAFPLEAATATWIKTPYDDNYAFDWGGGRVYMYAPHDGDNQKFYLEKYEDAYLVHSVSEGPGKCLDWDSGNGKPVMWECHKGSNQQWCARADQIKERSVHHSAPR